MLQEPASNGCSQPQKHATKWVAPIPSPPPSTSPGPKSHNHCAEVLVAQPVIFFHPFSSCVPISCILARRSCQSSPTTSQFTIGGWPLAAEGGSPFAARPLIVS